jgi:hypothetical protein
MEYIKKYGYSAIIVILLIIIFLQRSCNNKYDDGTPKQKEVVVPAVKDSFKSVKPTIVKLPPIHDTIIAKGDTIIVTEPLDKTLAKNYLQAKDSIGRLNLYLSSIQRRKYSQTFTDNNISITVDAEATGTINSIKPSYVIKERKVEAPVVIKQTAYALYTGVEIHNNNGLGVLGVKADLGVQNRRGDIYTIGYDTNNNIYLGYKIRLINIKK